MRYPRSYEDCAMSVSDCDDDAADKQRCNAFEIENGKCTLRRDMEAARGG